MNKLQSLLAKIDYEILQLSPDFSQYYQMTLLDEPGDMGHPEERGELLPDVKPQFLEKGFNFVS